MLFGLALVKRNHFTLSQFTFCPDVDLLRFNTIWSANLWKSAKFNSVTLYGFLSQSAVQIMPHSWALYTFWCFLLVSIAACILSTSIMLCPLSMYFISIVLMWLMMLIAYNIAAATKLLRFCPLHVSEKLDTCLMSSGRLRRYFNKHVATSLAPRFPWVFGHK